MGGSEEASFWTCLCIPRSVVGFQLSKRFKPVPEFPKAGVLQSGASLTRISRCLLHFIENQILPLTILCYLGTESRFPWGWQESFLLKNSFRLLEPLASTKPSFWELGSPSSFWLPLIIARSLKRWNCYQSLTLKANLQIWKIF